MGSGQWSVNALRGQFADEDHHKRDGHATGRTRTSMGRMCSCVIEAQEKLQGKQTNKSL